MKRVPLKTAIALKEIGFPQKWRTEIYYSLESDGEYGYQVGDEVSVNNVHKNQLKAVAAPFYLEVWLWLWRVKRINVWAEYYYLDDKWYAMFDSEPLSALKNTSDVITHDPEDAIIAAIEKALTLI